MKKLITLSFILFATGITNLCSAQWPVSTTVNVPVSVGASLNEEQGFWSRPAIASDGNAGAITCWYNQSPGPFGIYASRIDKNGVVLWTDTVCASSVANSRTMAVILSDGAGGAIIAWTDLRSGTTIDIYAARIGPTGNYIWGAGNGIAVATGWANKYYPTLCSDGANGAIITWTGNHSDGGDIFAKHVNATGVVSWGTTYGLVISDADSAQTFPVITEDGAGGAIIAWEDWRNGTSANRDIFAKRVDAGGATLWGGLLGSPICDTTGNQMSPAIVTDGAAGAIIAWADKRTAAQRTFSQRVDASGNMLWTSNGIVITNLSSENVRLATNGAGGAYMTWTTFAGQPGAYNGPQNIFAQLVTSAGVTKWTLNGISVCSLIGTQWREDIIPTSDGGALIAWGDYRDTANKTADIYIQKVDTSGSLLWTPVTGVPVTTAPCSQGNTFVSLVNDGCNGAILSWMDRRYAPACGLQYDIFAQNVNSDGTLGGVSGTIGCALVPPPVAAFQSSDSAFCANGCVSFTDMSTNSPTSWLWTFQGAIPSSSTDQNPPLVCYTDSGTFNVKLVVSNSGGSDSLTVSSLISVHPSPPTPTITISNDTLKCGFDSSYTSYQWYKDSVVIPNATKSYYIYSGNGNYNVEVTNGYGCNTAVGIVVTGISNLPGENLYSLSPNPATDELILAGYNKQGDVIITIYNILGEIMREERTKLSNRMLINISALPKGIYLVRVMNDGNRDAQWISRFVKQ